MFIAHARATGSSIKTVTWTARAIRHDPWIAFSKKQVGGEFHIFAAIYNFVVFMQRRGTSGPESAFCESS